MKHELLVPVGNKLSLIEAINNGADAVYLSGKLYGARAFAENFTLEEIAEATKLCHLYNVLIYITVNTLIKDSEINDCLEYIKKLHKIGVDAVIMQDVGLINLVHQTLPNLEIHASTQMHTHSKESLAFLEKLGIKRVVFARELPLTYINDIDTSLEKEVFIHGALCISYSGQCLFSSHILNRSGNRGECAGMCRLPYQLLENDNFIATEGNYLLSPKELCSITEFKKLMDSNVLCFKIEGRMKSPEYVGTITRIYKTLMNQYENGEELTVNEQDYQLLQAIYNRDFTTGHLFNDTNFMNILSPNHQGLKIGSVIEVTKKRIKIKLENDLLQFSGIRFKKANKGLIVNFLYNKEGLLINKGYKNDVVYLDNTIHLTELDDVLLTSPVVSSNAEITKKIPVTFKLIAKVGKKLKLTVSDGENHLHLTGDDVLESINSPISDERIKQCLQKSGNTPFIVTDITLDTDFDKFIRIGALNELRRQILTDLETIRENKKIPYMEVDYQHQFIKQKITNELSVLVTTKEQLEGCLSLGIKNIIVRDEDLMNDEYIYKVPRINIYHDYKYPNLLVTDYASLDKYPNNVSDYYLNITNQYSLDYIANYAKKEMLSTELSIDDYRKIINGNHNVEVLLYGRVELMVMKYCPLNLLVNKDKVCQVCKNSNNKYYLVDRMNYKYPLLVDKFHHTTILNHTVNNMINRLGELKKIGITNYRIEFFDESKEEVIKILESVIK